jgi:hypothetical protein
VIAALLLAAAAPATVAPVTAIDAERAFAADAQQLGQWTAFRRWAASDAILFTPRPVSAHDFLKGRKDPPQSVKWAPAASFMSCDGALALNTGPWTRDAGKTVGFFTTVWQRRTGGGWQWTLDHGDTLTAPRPLPPAPVVRRASCTAIAPLRADVVVRPGAAPLTNDRGRGRSPDGTLFYSWTVSKQGARQLTAYLWNGTRFDRIIDDRVAAPAP